MKKSEAIFAILSDAYGTSPWSIQQIEADLQQVDTEYIPLVSSGPEWIGFLALQHLSGEVEVTQIALKKAYQGQGLSHQLMLHLDKKTEPIFLEVRESHHVARSLYEKHGFEVVGRRKAYYQCPCEDAILMARKGRVE